MRTPGELSLQFPESFVLVPTESPAAFGQWAEELVAARRAGVGAMAPTLDTDVHRLREAIAASTEIDRRWFCVIPAAPYRHGIAAFGWVRMASAGGLTAEQMRTQAGAATERRFDDSLMAELSMHEVGAYPTLVIHQFQAVEASDSAVLVERCGALMLDEQADLAVSVEIASPDLRLFQDVVSTVLAVLGSVSIRAAVA